MRTEEPIDFVRDAIKYKRSGKVLDLGAGQGRNSLFFARTGFRVTAVDSSPVAIGKITKQARRENLFINARVEDVRIFDFDSFFDVILMTFVLHHLLRSEGVLLIEKIKDKTSHLGLNVIAAFTKNGDFFKGNQSADKFYLEEGELKKIYGDWRIIKWSEKRTRALQKTSEKKAMFNITSFLLAQKP